MVQSVFQLVLLRQVDGGIHAASTRMLRQCCADLLPPMCRRGLPLRRAPLDGCFVATSRYPARRADSIRANRSPPRSRQHCSSNTRSFPRQAHSLCWHFIDRNSLFECRGGAPYKSTVKQYFLRFTETALCSKCKCLAALWRIGDFCPICGSISSNSTTSAVFAGRENFMRQPRRLSNRVYHTCFSAVDRTRINNQSPQS
jgi:hypothetical protein